MEKLVIELITFLQKWGLWRGVMILTEGKAYSYSDNKKDVYCGLSNVEVFVCENPDDFTTGITDEIDSNGNHHSIMKTFSNPEHILDMVYEGPLNMLLGHDIYETRKSDISEEAWKYIFENTDILDDYLYEKCECTDASGLLGKILEDRFENDNYISWDPLVFDTWEEYQEVAEDYETGEGMLTPTYLRYGTYEEYLSDMEQAENLTVEDIEPLWDKMVSDAKKDFFWNCSIDDSVISFPEITGHLQAEFADIFERHELWYDYGFSWSLTCYKK